MLRNEHESPSTKATLGQWPPLQRQPSSMVTVNRQFARWPAYIPFIILVLSLLFRYSKLWLRGMRVDIIVGWGSTAPKSYEGARHQNVRRCTLPKSQKVRGTKKSMDLTVQQPSLPYKEKKIKPDLLISYNTVSNRPPSGLWLLSLSVPQYEIVAKTFIY